MHLAKRLNEELANQAAQNNSLSYGLNRSASPEQQRSRSYDHKSPQKNKGRLKDDILKKLEATLTEYELIITLLTCILL